MDIMSLLMAQRAGGGSGGSVNSVNGVKPDDSGNVALKYDDLEGKPVYKADEEVPFVKNETHTSALNEPLNALGVLSVALYDALSGMLRAKNCTVTWDGVTKTHDPVDLELMGNKFTAYGNVGIFAAFGVSAENTGEPYVLMYLENGFTIVVTTDTVATEHAISISGFATVYHKLDQVYIDIPMFDLIEMGVTAVTINGDSAGFASDIDTSEIFSACEKGTVKFRFNIDNGDGGIFPVECLALGTKAHEQWWFIVPYDGSLLFVISITSISVSIHVRRFATSV